jgi:hypothetical protein
MRPVIGARYFTTTSVPSCSRRQLRSPDSRHPQAGANFSAAVSWPRTVSNDSKSMKLRWLLLVGDSSAFRHRPHLGMASSTSGSRSGGSRPASCATAIAFSLASMALEAAASAFMFSSACSAAGASASWVVFALALPSCAYCCR